MAVARRRDGPAAAAGGRPGHTRARTRTRARAGSRAVTDAAGDSGGSGRATAEGRSRDQPATATTTAAGHSHATAAATSKPRPTLTGNVHRQALYVLHASLPSAPLALTCCVDLCVFLILYAASQSVRLALLRHRVEILPSCR